MEAGSYYCIITIAFNSITESKLKIYDNGVYFTSTLKDKNNSPAYKAFIIAAGTKAIGNPCFTFMEDSSFFYSIYNNRLFEFKVQDSFIEKLVEVMKMHFN